jgi:hypothetical protein
VLVGEVDSSTIRNARALSVMHSNQAMIYCCPLVVTRLATKSNHQGTQNAASYVTSPRFQGWRS